jgi:hypothetical protein
VTCFAIVLWLLASDVYVNANSEFGKHVYCSFGVQLACQSCVCSLPVYSITRGGFSGPVYPHPPPLLSGGGAVARLFTASPFQEKKVGHYHDCEGMLRLLFAEESLTLPHCLISFLYSTVTGPHRSLPTDTLLPQSTRNNTHI